MVQFIYKIDEYNTERLIIESHTCVFPDSVECVRTSDLPESVRENEWVVLGG